MSICLSAFLMLGTFLSTIPVYAQGSGTSGDDPYLLDGSERGTNPFSDKLSEEEINAHVASAKTKNFLNTLLVKYEVILKDGSTILIDSPEANMLPYDFLHQYGNQIKGLNWYMFAGEASSDGWDKITIPLAAAVRHTQSKLSYESGAYDGQRYPITKLSLNGQDLDPSTIFFEFKNGAKGRYYFSGSVEIDENPITYFQVRTNLVGSNSGPNGGTAGFSITPVYMYPVATIHYVDENAYRTLNGLDKTAVIPERSGGADYSSTAPAAVLDLSDLKASLQLGDRIGTSKNNLKPLFSTKDKSQTNVFIDLNTHQEVKGEARPTYDDVISQSQLAVGYAYVGDDIDKGANNVISPIIWPDGHITYDKHYYILERQMPSPIKIHITDEQDQGLKDVTFDLYRVNGEVETPIASGLTTNENGDLYVSQAESVAQSDLSTVTTSDAYDPQTGYIVQEDLAYLTPGNYRLKETTVPEGYKKTHFDFTVKAVQDMVADTSTPVPVQSFTFKNKSTYPVEYSFVSADNKKELPDEVKTLLPKDDELYVKGDIVNANEPETKSFKAKDGVWNFKAYDANSKQVNDENLKDGKIQFVGTWTFSPYAIALNQIPTIDAKDQVLTVNDSFDPMQGVSAHDEEEGDLTEKVEVIENNVPTDENKKTTKEGSYTVTYRVSDSQGASSIKTITVVVNPVMEELNHIPYITAEDQVLTIGDPLNLFYRVSAKDDEDGDLTGSVQLVKSTVPVDENGNTIKAGAFTVIYSVSDSQGASSTKTVSVVVNPKMESINQIPIIHAKDKTVSVGDVFEVMQDVTAEDLEDGDVTGNLRVLENNVPMDDNGKITKAGLFTITYQVTDSKGASSTKTITVTVNENTNNQPSKPEDGKNSSNDKGNSSTQKTERNSAKETKSSKGTKTSTGTYAAVFSGLASVSLAMLCGFVIVRKRQR